MGKLATIETAAKLDFEPWTSDFELPTLSELIGHLHEDYPSIHIAVGIMRTGKDKLESLSDVLGADGVENLFHVLEQIGNQHKALAMICEGASTRILVSAASKSLKMEAA